MLGATGRGWGGGLASGPGPTGRGRARRPGRRLARVRLRRRRVRVRLGRPLVRVLLGSLVLVLLGAGCATSTLSVTQEGYRNRRHDYTIGAAPAGWERVDVEGATVAFRRRGPNTMSLQSRCGRPVATPQLMARHLVIRLPERELVRAGPTAVDGRNAWVQVFDTVRGEVPVRVKTVTLVAQDCTFDWVLASTGAFDAAEADFDAWWGSFRLGSRYREAEVEG